MACRCDQVTCTECKEDKHSPWSLHICPMEQRVRFRAPHNLPTMQVVLQSLRSAFEQVLTTLGSLSTAG